VWAVPEPQVLGSNFADLWSKTWSRIDRPCRDGTPEERPASCVNMSDGFLRALLPRGGAGTVSRQSAGDALFHRHPRHSV
jgi:hypothetical protein